MSNFLKLIYVVNQLSLFLFYDITISSLENVLTHVSKKTFIFSFLCYNNLAVILTCEPKKL